MNICSKVLCGLFIILALAAASEAKEWRGIIPLHSTRQDVERKFGKPDRQPSYDAFYTLKDVSVLFHFSEGDCNKWPYGWDVPAGTVEEITVYPSGDLMLSELKFDRSKFREAFDVHYRIRHFIDDEAGYSIVASDGDKKIMHFSYYWAANEKFSRCRDSITGLPKGRPQAGYESRFDWYDFASLAEGNKHLDTFAQALLRDPNTEGYIFGYAGQRAYKDEGELRAEQAKSYVVEKYGIKAERIWAVDGGHSTYQVVELYVLPAGGDVPRPSPNIRPSSIEIIAQPTERQNPQNHP
jgi:hypothetical protein